MPAATSAASHEAGTRCSMIRQTHVGFGVMFGATLAIAWSLMTPALALAFWRSGARSLTAVTPWLALWLFTVVIPTTLAIRMHRRLNDLIAAAPDLPSRVPGDLSQVRWQILMCGGVSALAALVLVFRG
jgi:hypothetical protein